MKKKPLIMCVATPLSGKKILKEASGGAVAATSTHPQLQTRTTRTTTKSTAGEPGRPQHTMVRMIGDEFLTEERDRKYYADHYTCNPPPFFIILITFVELSFYTYYTVTKGKLNLSGPVPYDSVFIYRPDKRLELWRFVFYMFLHAGWLHLLFNLAVQLLVGLPLEMVHGSLRIAAVYMAGVLAGSLGTSVFDTDVYLVGASGGVYALLAAHLANVLLNYNNMEFGIIRLIGIFTIASADVGFAIGDRYTPEQLGPPVSYVAHLTGALAGLTIGVLVLKNFEQRLHEQLLWWVALGVYAACTIFAVMYNLMHPYYPWREVSFAYGHPRAT